MSPADEISIYDIISGSQSNIKSKPVPDAGKLASVHQAPAPSRCSEFGGLEKGCICSDFICKSGDVTRHAGAVTTEGFETEAMLRQVVCLSKEYAGN